MEGLGLGRWGLGGALGLAARGDIMSAAPSAEVGGCPPAAPPLVGSFLSRPMLLNEKCGGGLAWKKDRAVRPRCRELVLLGHFEVCAWSRSLGRGRGLDVKLRVVCVQVALCSCPCVVRWTRAKGLQCLDSLLSVEACVMPSLTKFRSPKRARTLI